MPKLVEPYVKAITPHKFWEEPRGRAGFIIVSLFCYFYLSGSLLTLRAGFVSESKESRKREKSMSTVQVCARHD